MDALLGIVTEHLDRHDPGEVAGLYLYGSTVTTGRQPDSDIDLLLLTRRSLRADERAGLTRLLLECSGSHRRDALAPSENAPVELTGLALDRLGEWQDGWQGVPVRDFQYGEWLRPDVLAGSAIHAEEDPDVAILLATAHTANRVLRGPALRELVAPVPHQIVREAMLATVPDILEEIEGDERNTLLVLARMIVTLETGTIVPKHVAAEAVAPSLPDADRVLLDRARAGYLGLKDDDWDGVADDVTRLSHALADRLRAGTA